MAYYQTNEPQKGYNFFTGDNIGGVLDKLQIGERITKPGRIVNRIYKAADSNYCVFEVEDDNLRRFVVSGQFPAPPQVDSYCEFTGTVREYKRGRQLAVESYHSAMPETSTGIITLLTTLPGLDSRASRLYEVFGRDVLEVIKANPARVAKAIKGVSLARARIWQNHLLDREKTEKGMQTLLGFGLSPKQAGDLLEKYGGGVVDKIKEDAYFLMKELPHMSFTKCDTIALKNGAHVEDTSRLVQAMLYTLRQEASARGHCYLPMDEFLDKALRVINMSLDYRTAQRLVQQEGDDVRVCMGDNKAILSKESILIAMEEWQASQKRRPFYHPIFNVSPKLVAEAMELSGGTIHIDEREGEKRVYPTRLYYAEKLIGTALQHIAQNQVGHYKDRDAVICAVCQAEGVVLEERQMEAVQAICDGPGGVYLLTGSAGCGKTFTLNIIIKVLRQLQEKVYKRPLEAKILAPTGKAAKVASQSTGLPASTIHMALGLTQDGQYSKSVSGDVIVIDEFSMVDTVLAAELFAATAPMAKVIILGDAKQLPSIGPGLVLQDMIRSGKVPMIELNVVKRQGKGSGILENANRIINGEQISTITCGQKNLDGDAYVIEAESPSRCCSQVLKAVDRLLRLYPKEEVQVLCPQHKGETGTDVLNLLLQQQMNPHPVAGEGAFLNRKVSMDGEEKPLYFLPGDKVIHTKNNYKMQWYQLQGDRLLPDLDHVGIINGETGVVHSTGLENKHRVIVASYDGGFVKYEDDFSELDHAYALTIHKSQGSQWSAVVCPIVNSNRIMLSRNLFYTMYTRAQHTSVVVGNRAAMEYAVGNDTPLQRNTGLVCALSA